MTIMIECPYCQAHVEAEEGGQFEFGSAGDRPGGRYVLARCKRANHILLAVQENVGNIAEGDIWDVARRIFPEPDLRSNPKAPTDIRKTLDEALTCLAAHAYTATAILCRKALEGVAADKGIRTQNLVSALEKMRAAGLIDNRLYEWSDALRNAGNEAAHDVSIAISAEDARDIAEFTIAIVDYVYFYREQFENFRMRRKKK